MRLPYRLCAVVGVILICGILPARWLRRCWRVVEMPLVYLLFALAMGYQLWWIAAAMADGTLLP